jgi:hypothetical protein
LLSKGYYFEIDYNRDGDPDTGTGDNVGIELPIKNLDAPVLVPGVFDAVKQYRPIALLRGFDSSGAKKEVIIEMPNILVQNIIQISDKVMQDGSKAYLFDALSLSNLGQAHWSILGDPESKYI